MAPIGPTEDQSAVIVRCSQADCSIRGTRSASDDAVVLLPEFLHLLDSDKPEM
jgi:hypothetical protein